MRLTEKYKKFSHPGTGFKDHRGSVREPWRGPHEGKELPMMLAGVKPAAFVRHDDYHANFKKHVDSGKFISKPIDYFGLGRKTKVPEYIVGLKGENYRVNKLHKEFSSDTRHHARIGRLLGYSKDHIKKFIGDMPAWMKGKK